MNAKWALSQVIMVTQEEVLSSPRVGGEDWPVVGTVPDTDMSSISNNSDYFSTTLITYQSHEEISIQVNLDCPQHRPSVSRVMSFMTGLEICPAPSQYHTFTCAMISTLPPLPPPIYPSACCSCLTYSQHFFQLPQLTWALPSQL